MNKHDKFLKGIIGMMARRNDLKSRMKRIHVGRGGWVDTCDGDWTGWLFDNNYKYA